MVNTNDPASACGRNWGFSIVGTLPNALYHKRLGYIDAYVMYQLLQGFGSLADE